MQYGPRRASCSIAGQLCPDALVKTPQKSAGRIPVRVQACMYVPEVNEKTKKALGSS